MARAAAVFDTTAISNVGVVRADRGERDCGGDGTMIGPVHNEPGLHRCLNGSGTLK